jgi:hypothetical protein
MTLSVSTDLGWPGFLKMDFTVTMTESEGHPSQRVLVRQIYPDLSPAEAYERYCQRKRDHRDEIKARADILKIQ